MGWGLANLNLVRYLKALGSNMQAVKLLHYSLLMRPPVICPVAIQWLHLYMWPIPSISPQIAWPITSLVTLLHQSSFLYVSAFCIASLCFLLVGLFIVQSVKSWICVLIAFRHQAGRRVQP